MGLGWKIMKFYEDHPFTIDEWERLNKMKHSEPRIDWQEPIDLCRSMCCYAEIEIKNGHRYCSKCGSKMAGS
jgi:hypothetical protein